MKETVNVNVIEVPVTVVDSSGNPVRGLTAANFELYDGGKKQAITSFDKIDFGIDRDRVDRDLAAEPGRAALVPAALRPRLLLAEVARARAGSGAQFRQDGSSAARSRRRRHHRQRSRLPSADRLHHRPRARRIGHRRSERIPRQRSAADREQDLRRRSHQRRQRQDAAAGASGNAGIALVRAWPSASSS